MITTHPQRPAVRVMYAGLALTVVALAVPYVDHATANVLIRDTSGDTGLPPLLGWAGVLPCLAGLVAITLLWKERHELSR
jgi:hypothetical protein